MRLDNKTINSEDNKSALIEIVTDMLKIYKISRLIRMIMMKIKFQRKKPNVLI